MKTHQHRKEIEQLDIEIVKLIEKRWTLFLDDPNINEATLKSAYENLCDDPYNTLYETMDPDNAAGRWFLPDEVFCLWDIEEDDELAS